MKKKILITSVGTITLFSLCFTLLYLVNKQDINEEVYDYVIHYENKYIYDIKINENNIYVDKKEEIICIKDPCDPVKVDSFKIKNKKEYQKLINTLFKDKKIKEINITNDNLSNEEIKIISSIIKEEYKEDNKLSYTIIKSSQYDYRYSKRGYYVEKDSDHVIVTIAKGMMSGCKYIISISKVKVNDDGVEIYVKEPYLKEEVTCDSIIYPIIKVKFNKMPKYILVQNTDTLENFEKIVLEDTY